MIAAANHVNAFMLFSSGWILLRAIVVNFCVKALTQRRTYCAGQPVSRFSAANASCLCFCSSSHALFAIARGLRTLACTTILGKFAMPLCQHRAYRVHLATFLIFSLAAFAGTAQSSDLPRRAMIGTQLADATLDAENKPVAGASPGVRVLTVAKGSSAETLGVQVGDVVQSVNGSPVKVPADLVRWITSRVGGDAITLELLRGGERKVITGKLVERPREPSNDEYAVSYGQVASKRGVLRTISSSPKASGKHPALLFVQGVTLGSVDFPLTDANAYAQIVRAFARGGYVTMRVDKPGVGDSQGGPGTAVDFNDELDGYRQALKAMIARPDVDAERVFVFGHSMGGLWGPVLAGEFKLKGTIVSGTVFRTWAEYDLENTRRQAKLGGATEAEIHTALLQRAAVMNGVLSERLAPEALIKRDPALKEAVDEAFPGGLYGGRAVDFWRQVQALNLPAAWSKAGGAVLSLYGEADFVTAALDHQMMADFINAQRKSSATYKLVPRSDHAFLNVADQTESFKTWGKQGPQFNPNVLPMISEWITPLSGKPLRF
jgi:alpha-beta hydrolase superfamily lysophospholipase